MPTEARPSTRVGLSILTGDQAGRTVEIADEELVIGRSSDAGLTLHDANVSRRHAALRAIAEGQAHIRDLGSANGTFVDGNRVEQATLRGGEQLQLGDTVIHVLGGADNSLDTNVMRARQDLRPSESMVIRALRNSSVIRSLRADSAIQRLVIAPELKRTRYLTFAALCVALAAVLGLFSFLVFGGGGNQVQDAVAATEPSTVLVVPQHDGHPNGNGTGWVYDAKRGLIVTNAHVINDGETFQASVANKLVPARVLGVAPCDDLAVLQVPKTTGLKTLPLGSQGRLELGDTVVAVGYPQSASADAELTSTAGVVSRVRTTYSEPALDIPSYPNVIQTDAAINPGNSGGPLVDLDGRLVGVNSAGRTTSLSGRIVQGQSYAIGVDRVKQVVPLLAQGRSIGWAGLDFRFPSAHSLPRGLPQGIYVTGSVRGSPAAAARLDSGSGLLVGANGHLLANTLASWCAAVSGTHSGQAVNLRIIPPGARKPETTRVRLG